MCLIFKRKMILLIIKSKKNLEKTYNLHKIVVGFNRTNNNMAKLII